MDLKDQIKKIISPLITKIAHDIVKLEQRINNTNPYITQDISVINNPPKYVGQIILVNGHMAIAIGTSSKNDWKTVILRGTAADNPDFGKEDPFGGG